MDAVSTFIAQKLEIMLDDSGVPSFPAIALGFFNIFTICIRTARTTQGFQQLSTACAGYFCQTFYRLTATYPTSSILEYFHLRYHHALLLKDNSTDLPSCHPMIMISALIGGKWSASPIWRDDNRSSDRERLRFARDIAELAQAEYRRKQEVSIWIVDFAFDSLFLDPLPSASIIANCLKVLAIDLHWVISGDATSYERYICLILISAHLLTGISVPVEAVLEFIIRNLETMFKAN